MHPSAQALLKSNDRLTEEQLAEYQAQLKATRARIAKIRQELDAELEIERCYELLISPTRRIPEDILQEIFFHCLPEKLNECQPSVDKAPLLLCLVCSRWRSVAISTAGLWKSIFIEGPENHQRRRHLRWVDPWLQRSCEASLDVYLDLGWIEASRDTQPMEVIEQQLTKLLAPIGHRIHHLTLISFSLRDLIHLSPFNTPAPSDDRDEDRLMLHDVPSAFLSSPHLHTLDFSGIDWAMEVIPDAGINLIRLVIQNVSTSDVSRICRDFPGLQYASFAIVEDDLTRGETLDFPVLTSLTLDFELHHSFKFKAVMEAIRTPSLTTFHLRLPKRFQPAPSILSRLSEFHLNIAITSSVLEPILNKCSRIQSFTEKVQRCIHLEEIQLEVSAPMLKIALVDMITSRVKSRPANSACLRKVRVYSTVPYVEDSGEEPFPPSVDVSMENSSWVHSSTDRRRETKRIWNPGYAALGPASWKALEASYHSSEESEGED
ncbi:hypothetical protein BKA70DRAFT_1266415 [Coprinopsis sp. MPI-PUGE-AT-0042]|nr:hypothetical protein BKA70DRAFT_1266415 [Coprinopsis sp. MPI-PUGE-AT-0042]